MWTAVGSHGRVMEKINVREWNVTKDVSVISIEPLVVSVKLFLFHFVICLSVCRWRGRFIYLIHSRKLGRLIARCCLSQRCTRTSYTYIVHMYSGAQAHRTAVEAIICMTLLRSGITMYGVRHINQLNVKQHCMYEAWAPNRPSFDSKRNVAALCIRVCCVARSLECSLSQPPDDRRPSIYQAHFYQSYIMSHVSFWPFCSEQRKCKRKIGVRRQYTHIHT